MQAPCAGGDRGRDGLGAGARLGADKLTADFCGKPPAAHAMDAIPEKLARRRGHAQKAGGGIDGEWAEHLMRADGADP